MMMRGGGEAADEGGIPMYVLHCYSSLSRGESAYREMTRARCGAAAASHQSQVHAAQLPAPDRYSSPSIGESAYREMTRARGAVPPPIFINLRCTLRNFPHLIDHCIEWARDKFAEVR